MNKETTPANTAQAPPGSEALTWRGWQAGAARRLAVYAPHLTGAFFALTVVGLAGVIAAGINVDDASIYGQCNGSFRAIGTANPQCVQQEIDHVSLAYPLLAIAAAFLAYFASGTATMLAHLRKARKLRKTIAPDWRRLKDWYAGGGLPREKYRVMRTLMEPLHKGRPETLAGKTVSRLLTTVALALVAFAGIMTLFGFFMGEEGNDCRREYQTTLCDQLFQNGNTTMMIGWAAAGFGLIPLVLGMDLRIASKRLHAALLERLEVEEDEALHILNAHHREHGPLHLPDDNDKKAKAAD